MAQTHLEWPELLLESDCKVACFHLIHRYAIRDGSKIKIFKNFKERKSFKPDYGAESKQRSDWKIFVW